MKVLAVTNLWPTGPRPDLGTFVRTQVDGLRRIGVSVEVEFVDRAAEGRAAYRTLRDRVSGSIARHRPDVVHTMYGGVLAERSTAAAARAGLPAVVSFCGADLLGERFDGRRLGASVGVWASRRAARRADAVIVKSPELAAALPDRVRGPVEVIANGVDLSRFAPSDPRAARRALGWAPDGAHVLFVAHRQAPSRKRPDLAAAAVEELRRAGLPVTLQVMAGVAHGEVPTWLNAADVLLVTSAQEGSPNIVREALACGTPVLSVPVGDVAEQLADVDGCRVAPADPAALAAALAEMTATPTRVDAAELLADRSVEAVADRLAEVYDRVRCR